MTNEAISYSEFCERARQLAPWLDTLQDAGETVLTGAWEECAWISTLTDQRILAALESRRP